MNVREFENGLSSLYADVAGHGPQGEHEIGLVVSTLYPNVALDRVFDGLVRPFVESYAAQLHRVYRSYYSDPRRPPQISSAVSILIFERMTNDRFRLRANWFRSDSMASYERWAAVWGVPGPYSLNR